MHCVKSTYLVKFLLLDPGERAESDLAHAVGGALEALLGVSAILGRRHELGHDVIQLFNLEDNIWVLSRHHSRKWGLKCYKIHSN